MRETRSTWVKIFPRHDSVAALSRYSVHTASHSKSLMRDRTTSDKPKLIKRVLFATLSAVTCVANRRHLYFWLYSERWLRDIDIHAEVTYVRAQL